MSQLNLNWKFIYESLASHNIRRRQHGVPPLVHNVDLSIIAQNYADFLAVRNRKLKHSHGKFMGQPMGENLAYYYSRPRIHFKGEMSTEMWYEEIKYHEFGDYQEKTGHFTQMVWRSTREVGFGLATAVDGSYFAVATYFPAGNVIGEFQHNVNRPLNSYYHANKLNKHAKHDHAHHINRGHHQHIHYFQDNQHVHHYRNEHHRPKLNSYVNKYNLNTSSSDNSINSNPSLNNLNDYFGHFNYDYYNNFNYFF